MSLELLTNLHEALSFNKRGVSRERILARYGRMLDREQDRLKPYVNRYMSLLRSELQKGIKNTGGGKRKAVETSVEKMINWEQVHQDGKLILKPEMLRILIVGSESVIERRMIKQEVEFRTDPIGVEAVSWSEDHTAHLVTIINDETMGAITTFIIEAIHEGQTIQKIHTALRPLVGLTEPHTRAVGRFATELYTRPKYSHLTDIQREKRIARYTNKLHRYRTFMIARTETSYALNEGIRQGFKQMGVKRLERIENPNCCEQCDLFNGEIYTIEEAKNVLPEHPMCCGTMVAA